MSSRPTSAQPAVDLDARLLSQTVWKANRAPATADARGESTGHAALDAALPQRGWPRRALTELLLPADGIGELALLLPTLARFTQAGGIVALVAPPYLPYAPAWQSAGIDLRHLEIIDADPRNALWAFEQCLRSAACAAVIGWPLHADGPSLRRLQVAADTGDCLGFALRDRRHAANPSPAALRMEYVPGVSPGEAADAMDAPRWLSASSLPRGDARVDAASNVHALPHRAALPPPMTRSLPLFPAGGEAANLRTLAASARAQRAGIDGFAGLGDGTPGTPETSPLQRWQRQSRVDGSAEHGDYRAPPVDRAAAGHWHVRKCRGGNLPLRGIALQRLN